jgi:hypothetical protein
MIRYDDGMMRLAISRANENHGFPAYTGFLHRTTGEIVFISECEGETAAWFGTDVAVDEVFDRARIDTAPDEWVEIPKHYGDAEDEDVFIQQFLSEHGLR